MAVSRLKITFGQNLPQSATVSFNFKAVDTGIETPVTFTWVTTRVIPYEVTRLPNTLRQGEASAQAFKNSFEIDEPLYPISITFSKSSSFVIITSEDENITFSGGVATFFPGQPADKVFFEISRVEGITITNIDSDNYLINNEIWIGLSTLDLVTRYNVSLTNLNNSKFTKPFVYFTNNGNAFFNIQPILKSLFDYPNIRNQNRFKIDVQAYNGNILVSSSSFNRNFIRGGNRTELTNQNISLGTILRPSIKLPIWDGYPADQYFLDNDGSIQITPFSEIPENLKDYKRVKGCSNIYFKFLNQNGGYSNWLFESFSNPETNNNLGAFVRNNDIEDLGNLVDNSLQVFSKVPKEYYGLIKDLFVSPEIYVWQDLRWKRVLSGKNTSDYDEGKRAYSVKAKFDIENRYNPSLLWSN